MFVSFISSTIGTTSGPGAVDPYRASEFIYIHCAQYLVFCIVFCKLLNNHFNFPYLKISNELTFHFLCLYIYMYLCTLSSLLLFLPFNFVCWCCGMCFDVGVGYSLEEYRTVIGMFHSCTCRLWGPFVIQTDTYLNIFRTNLRRSLFFCLPSRAPVSKSKCKCAVFTFYTPFHTTCRKYRIYIKIVRPLKVKQ